MTQTSDPSHELATGSELPARGALLTLTEAAEACGVSRSTMKRRLPEFANAEQDVNGAWRVPISDLLGGGLKLRPRPETRANGQVTQGHDPAQNGADVGRLQTRIEALTAELANERTARQLAEVKATAEARIAALYAANLEDLRYSLRALNGPPQPQEEGTQGHTPNAPVPGAEDGARAAEAVPRRAAPPRRGFRAWLRGG